MKRELIDIKFKRDRDMIKNMRHFLAELWTLVLGVKLLSIVLAV